MPIENKKTWIFTDAFITLKLRNKKMIEKTEFVLIRHGETLANKEAILQGQSESALSEEGLEQAKLLAKRLQYHPPFDHIFSSDLTRCMITAQCTVDLIGGEIIAAKELREWDFGELEGRKRDELIKEYPEVMNFFINSHQEIIVPGGEKRSELESRIKNYFTYLAKEYTGKRLLVFSHGGALRSLFRFIVGYPAANNIFPQISNASYSSCIHSKNGWQLVCWNDTAHLNKGFMQEEATL